MTGTIFNVIICKNIKAKIKEDKEMSFFSFPKNGCRKCIY